MKPAPAFLPCACALYADPRVALTRGPLPRAWLSLLLAAPLTAGCGLPVATVNHVCPPVSVTVSSLAVLRWLEAPHLQYNWQQGQAKSPSERHVNSKDFYSQVLGGTPARAFTGGHVE